MCGICGWINSDPNEPVDADVLRRMTQRLVHRGPDGEGMWIGPAAGLGHRRLSVIDLSDAGRQPLSNETGTVWVVFNGEIYNFRELRSTLLAQGHVFRSQTDTEVIVHLYEENDTNCFPHLRGMFAFALWDARRRRLLLARDRFGQKPLYYHVTPERILFASELHALLAGLERVPPVDPFALDEYLTYQYVPSPRSIFRGINKLPPAHSLVWETGRVRVERYWSLRPLRSVAVVNEGTEAALLEELRERFDEAVRSQLVSDVPLGVFLSGGIDSSLIVESMARQVPDQVQTFSAGFDDVAYDETPFARQVAAASRTHHHELRVTCQSASILPTLIRHFGEPFADSSAVPTYYVSQLAAAHVKVILSGDGGDEQFAGYPRYVTNQWVELVGLVPAPILRGAVRPLIQRLARRCSYTAFLSRLDRFLMEAGSTALRNAYCLSHFTPPLKGRCYAASWARRLDGYDAYHLLVAAYAASGAPSFTEQALYADCLLYLPDDLLTKVDRMSMAHGLEVRSPFLDHELAEFVAGMPLQWKLHRSRTKVALRRLGQGQLPPEVLRRPKMGFAVPLAEWLRGELRPALFQLVLGERAMDRGYFNPQAVRLMVEEHLSGRRDWRYPLWNLLVLELWHRLFVDGELENQDPAGWFTGVLVSAGQTR